MAISLICAKNGAYLIFFWPTAGLPSQRNDATPAYIACCYYSWDWNLMHTLYKCKKLSQNRWLVSYGLVYMPEMVTYYSSNQALSGAILLIKTSELLLA